MGYSSAWLTFSAVLWPTPLIDLASAYERIRRGWLRMGPIADLMV